MSDPERVAVAAALAHALLSESHQPLLMTPGDVRTLLARTQRRLTRARRRGGAGDAGRPHPRSGHGRERVIQPAGALAGRLRHHAPKGRGVDGEPAR